MDILNPENMPRHIAIIMDGNGRWAEKRCLGRINGHRKGVEAARMVVKSCRELGIEYLTLYTFSSENWNRPPAEVKMLMGFLERHLKGETPMMMENGIRFKAIGNIEDLPLSVRNVIADLEEKTSGNDDMVLQMALSYGSRAELTEACRRLARRVESGEITPDDITEDMLGDCLYTAGVPDPDLLIRTSGEMRISNFLLWQIAYTELCISDVLWPDFKKEHLIGAISDFQSRERRFGLTGKQAVKAVV
jgi:undecaprenyl diphosphate synthase